MKSLLGLLASKFPNLFPPKEEPPQPEKAELNLVSEATHTPMSQADGWVEEE